MGPVRVPLAGSRSARFPVSTATKRRWPPSRQDRALIEERAGDRAPLPASSPPVPILFVHYGEEWIRGSERCLLDLLEHLDRGRFDPFLWCNGNVLASAARRLGVPVQVDAFPILFDDLPPRFPFLHYARTVRKAFRIVREHGIRIVHSNSGAPVQWMLPVARTFR